MALAQNSAVTSHASRQEGNDPQLHALKLPPHSVEAEQSLLGALLLDNLAFDRVADIVGAEDFYRDDHRRIWRHVARLIEAGKPADVVTVSESIDLDVPAPVISLALIERLRSRDAESFSDRLLAAMRNEFGGHAIRKEG